MELSLNQRAQMAVKWLASQRGVNQKDIGVLLGYTSSTSFSQVLNDKRAYPKKFPERIAALDPRINIDFLTGVSDEMLIGEGTPEVKPKEPAQPVSRVGIFVPPELAQMVTDLTSTIKEQQATVREQQAMIRSLIDEWRKDKEGK